MRKPRLLLDWITLDSDDSIPLYRQLYLQLRTAIVHGQIPAGSSLPSSRALAEDLDISRNTVLNAYDQLLAEGYLDTSLGSETIVAEMATSSKIQNIGEIGRKHGVSLSKRARLLQSSPPPIFDLPEAVAFTPGVPSFDYFPVKIWSRLLARQAFRMQPAMADNDIHGGGYGPLREELARYLRSARMVECRPDQIFVVTSSRAAADLVCRVATEPGDAAVVEDPGYVSGRTVIRTNGLRILPIAVDADGLRVEVVAKKALKAKLAYVTPSHQWPTGVSLSAERRNQLLEWADRSDAWVIEDDYDSEFRFGSRPLATLQGLDGGKRVFYSGTFAKTLFPSLRVAYIVVPRPFIDAFNSAVFFAGQEPPLHVQAALADFLSGGFFATHIRRMRRIYKRRQGLLLDTLVRILEKYMPIERPAGGMQVALRLPDAYPAAEVSRAAIALGLHVRPVSVGAVSNPPPNALHLGYAAVPDHEIEPAAEALAGAILSVG